jgi:16S rRNA (cytosine1402-N4)-methyltransferase
LGNFAEIDTLLPSPTEKFEGILADLGVSSHQIDDASRGFSFREGAPLDMRMNAAATETAADFLMTRPEEELADAFRDYGDEPKARRLAREVVRRRANRPFETSDDFVGAIRATLGPRSGPGEFARLFQAVRIAVNQEMLSLETALPVLRDRLVPGGVLAVISYHSGEDRLVKHAMRDWSRDCVCPPRQLECTCRGRALGRLLMRKSVTATEAEIARNPRARSARLRAWRSAA